MENLRLEAGRNSHDPATQALVGELTIASSEFAVWWQEHRVFQRTHGDKRFRHPIVGDLTLQYESVSLPGDPDQTLFLYTAEVGTEHREALDLLSSWAATAGVDGSRGHECELQRHERHLVIGSSPSGEAATSDRARAGSTTETGVAPVRTNPSRR
ncbi:hypothetical protein DEJ33_12745 [Curtobacterium sp. MCPF17_047]|nr:hypothetical protein DEJ24_12715 [Curtobacterium sp. MCPF17_001]PZF63982.1 hypothetical protein DEJ33_12745 [Curtobacterium sp. MCPF17_047]